MGWGGAWGGGGGATVRGQAWRARPQPGGGGAVGQGNMEASSIEWAGGAWGLWWVGVAQVGRRGGAGNSQSCLSNWSHKRTIHELNN